MSQSLSLAPEAAIAWCLASWPHRCATRYEPHDVAVAAQAFTAIGELGVRSVPFFAVADLVALGRLGWRFPFRALREGEGASSIDGEETASWVIAQALNRFLVEPHFAALRELLQKPATDADDDESLRFTLLFELLFAGVEEARGEMPYRLPPLMVRADELASQAIELLERERDAAEGVDDTELTQEAIVALGRELAGNDGEEGMAIARAIVAAQSLSAARFLAARFGAAAPTGSTLPEVSALRVGKVDLYELTHAATFRRRSDRLRGRVVGRFAERLGPVGPLLRHVREAKPESAAMLEEETRFPAGGSAGLTTRGAFESLLPSELVYLEEEGPDLFALKLLENELLYFVRDEGVIVTRRRRVGFVVWNLPGFEVKLSGMPVSVELGVEGLLLSLLRDAYAMWQAEGVRAEVAWHVTESDRGGAQRGLVSAPAEMGAGPARLFELLFADEVERGEAAFDELRAAGELAERLETPGGRATPWFVLVPPSVGSAARVDPPWADTAVRAALAERHARGARPVIALEFALALAGDGAADVGDAMENDRATGSSRLGEAVAVTSDGERAVHLVASRLAVSDFVRVLDGSGTPAGLVRLDVRLPASERMVLGLRAVRDVLVNLIARLS